jgi:hypothetical protein
MRVLLKIRQRRYGRKQPLLAVLLAVPMDRQLTYNCLHCRQAVDSSPLLLLLTCCSRC